MKNKRGQIGIEYLLIMGFIMFSVIGLLGVGLNYMGNIKSSIITSQTSSFAEQVITTSEKVFYEGEPSKATITVYIPEEVKKVQIVEDSLLIDVQTSLGISRKAYYSNVPINGSIDPISGSRRIQIVAQENEVIISQV